MTMTVRLPSPRAKPVIHCWYRVRWLAPPALAPAQAAPATHAETVAVNARLNIVFLSTGVMADPSSRRPGVNGTSLPVRVRPGYAPAGRNSGWDSALGLQHSQF